MLEIYTVDNRSGQPLRGFGRVASLDEVRARLRRHPQILRDRAVTLLVVDGDGYVLEAVRRRGRRLVWRGPVEPERRG